LFQLAFPVMTLPKDIYCQSDKPNKPAIVKLLRSRNKQVNTPASSMTPTSSSKETLTLEKL
jgi:hypothetical protein